MKDVTLSAGQARVWHIAQAVLQGFPTVSPATDDQDDKRKPLARQAYQMLLDRLAQDQIVCHDPYTGARAAAKEIANSYSAWIAKYASLSKKQLTSGESLPINFNRIIFQGSAIESCIEDKKDQRLYQGGCARPLSTARAVLSLVQGEPMSPFQMSMSYYVNSQILSMINGNHRVMAYKLLGLNTLPNKVITLYEDTPNEDLNQALLRLESVYTLPHPHEKLISVGDQIELAVTLGKKYGAYSTEDPPNELFSFTKHDLLRSSIQPSMGKSFLDLLNNYATVHTTLPSLRSKPAWWQTFFRSKTTLLPLENNQQEAIRARWLARRESPQHEG